MIIRRVWSSLFLAACTACLPQVASAECPLCSGNYECSDNCSFLDRCCNRPNKIKIIVKRPICASPFSGIAAAPVGYAMPSVSAAFVIPTASTASAGLTADSVRQIVADELKKSGTASAGTASASTETTCKDPCGDILRLQRDVRDLTDNVNRLARQVEFLAKDYKDRHP